MPQISTSLLDPAVVDDSILQQNVCDRFWQSVQNQYLAPIVEAEIPWTQAQVSRRTGITQGHLSHLKSAFAAARDGCVNAKQSRTPGIDVFCRRSAMAGTFHRLGEYVRWKAFGEVYPLIAIRYESVAQHITPEQACCCHHVFRILEQRASAAAQRNAADNAECVQKLTDSECHQIIGWMSETFFDLPRQESPADVPPGMDALIQRVIEDEVVGVRMIKEPEEVRSAIRGRLKVFANTSYLIWKAVEET